MQKVIVILVGALFVSSVGFAAVNDLTFDIYGSQYIVDASNTSLPAGNMYQIIWSADNVYMPADMSLAGASVGTSVGGDFVIFSSTTPDAGGFNFPVNSGTLGNDKVGGSSISSGYVYGYVYNAGGNGTIEVGDYYGRSEIYSASNFAITDPPNPPKQLDFAPNGDLVLDTFQVVPEPSTMGLIALGALTLAGRRMRRNKK